MFSQFQHIYKTVIDFMNVNKSVNEDYYTNYKKDDIFIS